MSQEEEEFQLLIDPQFQKQRKTNVNVTKVITTSKNNTNNKNNIITNKNTNINNINNIKTIQQYKK